ncbi:hypothetical protein ACKWTF_001417 [Chironomus riparius]
MRNVRTSSSPTQHNNNINKRFFRTANLIREYKNYQYFERRSDNSLDHTKRNLKGTNVNSDIINHHHNNLNDENANANNNNNNNNLITYEHLSESSWIELVLPFTILAITILAVILIAVILFIWIQKYYREKREKSQIVDHKIQSKIYCTKKKCDRVNNNRNKMNSRKWLKGKSKKIDSQIVNDLEQKLETVEFKSTPPTSPNSQKLQEDQQQQSDDDEEETETSEINIEKESTIIPCPLAISDISIASIIQPPQTTSSSLAASSEQTSPLSLLQEEVHCIQPKEEQAAKIYKSIATSPPPFSPTTILQHYASQHHKYVTQGTQTYFTKAPNSPNNLLSSSFAVLQTPTTSSCTSNPFIISPSFENNNKENKEPFSKLRNICLNKTISSFKHDNSGVSCGTSSSASSPSSVISTSPKIISTSPKVNTNVLQQQNSPINPFNSPNSFNFSPKLANAHTNTGSPPISATTQKVGNYFRFPEIETPPGITIVTDTIQLPARKLSCLEKQHSTNISTDLTDVPIITKAFENLSMENIIGKNNDKESIILKIDEVDSPILEEKMSPFYSCNTRNNNNDNIVNNNNSENTLTIRRARLKSISLDSDGARLVEENLTMPVEELVEIASYNNKQITDSDIDVAAASCANNNNNNNNRFNPKNKYNLTINLDFRDSSLDITENSDINMNQEFDDDDDDDDDDDIGNEGMCRTPTMKYFVNKKAVSLDSTENQQEHGNKMQQQAFPGKTASTETFNYYFGQNNKMNSSISVPSTPKHLTSNKLKISTSEDRNSTGGGQTVCGRYNRNKLGSYDENADKLRVTTSTQHHQQQLTSYKTNLTASIQTLNISSSNLKTLPEIMSINDFDGTQSTAANVPRIGPPSIPSTSKSGILQRRGSNHSLTLNLDGSCGNLTRGLSCSNYSLGNLHGSHLNIAGSNYNLQGQPNHRVVTVKKNLLQRRGSNTSLTLNIQGSNNNLNRFNSHSSLNITGSSQKKGLLERRNSNASLTLNVHNRGLSISNCNLRGSECSLSSVNTNQMAELMMLEQEAEHQEAENEKEKAASEKYAQRNQRKFLSSENLHNMRSSTAMSMANTHRQQSQHQTPYGSIDNLKQAQPYHHNEKVPVISTKPLSPQSTSEDFKIYLANIQFLQSASNVLDEEHLKTLNELFQKSYKNHPKENLISSTMVHHRQFNNDDILNSKIGSDGTTLISFGTGATTSPDEDQKQLLIKLHQEFWNLPTNYQEKPMVFGSQSKNRYKTILPNEHSRVILQREEGIPIEPYINANFIKGPDYTTDCYIATQGPMQNTVYEFWLMVFQNIQKKHPSNGIQKIAMLTDFIESQRQKCAVYFPKESGSCEIFTNSGLPNEENIVRDRLETILSSLPSESSGSSERDEGKQLPKISFNYFIIKNIGLKQKNGYSIRKLALIYGNYEIESIQQYTVYHYWFPDWPDHRSPQDIDVLLDMSLDLLDGDCTKDFTKNNEVTGNNNINKNNNNCKNPLPIIHCSAGIGRTGCLAAILNGLGQIRSNSNNPLTGEGTSVDILGIVCNLRLQRGGMVQNSEQYELIHRSLCLYQQKLRKN